MQPVTAGLTPGIQVGKTGFVRKEVSLVPTVSVGTAALSRHP